MDTDIAKREEFRVCGYETILDESAGSVADIGKYRADFEGMQGSEKGLYTVIKHGGQRSGRCLIGIEVSDGSLKDGMNDVVLKSGRYCVTNVPDGLQSSEAWRLLFDRELPNKGYEYDGSPCFEFHGSDGCRTLWAPVNAAIDLSDKLRLLSEIKGIYAVPALKRLASKQKILEMSAKSVGGSIGKKIAIMNEYLRNDNADAFIIEIHGIKSSLGTIGAEGRAEKAAALEAKAKAGELEYCKAAFADFAEDCEALGAKLEEIFAQ